MDRPPSSENTRNVERRDLMTTRIDPKRGRSALLLVDIQPDFLSGGALEVSEGDAILEPVRKLLSSRVFGLFVATQDWHPANHISFASQHDGKRAFQTIELYQQQQTLWPDHCVQGTPGAELSPDLDWRPLSAIVRKGSDPACDSYSGFRNNWNERGERPSTGLAGYLKERGVADVFLCGLARDVCVKWTAEDAAEAGFRVRFLWDATRPVDPRSDDDVQKDLAKRSIEVIRTDDLRL